MADDLPQYVSTAGVSVGPELDTSNMFNKYQQIFGDIEQTTRPIAQSLEEDIGREQGEVAGQNPGFQTGLGIGIASRAYNEAGLASNKLSILSDATQQVNNFKLEAMGLNPDGSKIPGTQGITQDSIENFNNQVKSYANGMLQTIPSANRQAFTSYLSGQSTIASSHLLTGLQKKQTIANNLNVVNEVNNNTQDILSKASSGSVVETMYAKNLMASTSQILDNEAIQNNFPLKQAERLQKQVKQSFMTGTILGNFNNIVSNHPDQALEYINNVRTNPEVINEFGEDGANAKASQLKAILNGRLQTQGVTASSIAQSTQALLMHSWSSPNSPVDQTAMQRITEHNMLTGNQANTEELQQEIPIAQKYGSYLQEYQNDPNPQDQDKIKNQVNNDILGLKYNNPLDLKTRKWAQQTLDQMNALDKKRFSDPVGYIQQTPGYQAIESNQASNVGVMKPLQDLQNQYILNYQHAQNIDPQQYKIMPQSDISTFDDTWKTANQAKRNNLINGLVQKYGQYVGLAIHQLQKSKNGPSGLLSYFNIATNPSTKGSLQAFSTAMSIPKKQAIEAFSKEKMTWNDAKQAIKQDAMPTISLFSKMHGYDPTQTEERLNTAAYYTSYLMDQNNETFNKATQDAADLIFNDHTNAGSFNGQQYAIPSADIYGNQIDPTNIPAMAKTYAIEKLHEGIQVDPAYPRNGLTEDEVPRSYDQDVRLHGYWTNTQGGLMLMNSLHRPVKDSSGEPIMMSWSDVQNPSSAPYSAFTMALDSTMRHIQQSIKNTGQEQTFNPNLIQEIALKHLENKSLFSGTPYPGENRKALQLIGQGLARDVSNRFTGAPDNLLDTNPFVLQRGSNASTN